MRPFLIQEIVRNPARIISLFCSKTKTIGFKKTVKRMLQLIFTEKAPISPYNNLMNSVGYKYIENFDLEKIEQEIKSFRYTPLISIIMPVYNVDPKWLELAIRSLENQFYTHWELCIADDCSSNQNTVEFVNKIRNKKIKIIFLKTNMGISGASNEAIKLSVGDYIGLLDNDDELTKDALYEVVKKINNTNAEFIYSDEDKLEMNGVFSQPHFKPDYSGDLLLGQNYICHFTVFHRKLYDTLGGFSVGLDGSQDHDLFLRYVEKANKICHIPKILYHWRMIPGSTASKMSSKNYAWASGRLAVEKALKRRKIAGSALFGHAPGTYKIKRKIIGNPMVSIIIPFKDKPEYLHSCLTSIFGRDTYHNIEIIAVNNNSVLPETADVINKFASYENIRFVEYKKPFNYSLINNYGVEISKGEHILLLNSDIEFIAESWLEYLLEHSQRDDVGAVGARLYFSDNSIQHAGIIMGLGGIANSFHYRHPRFCLGYFSRPHMIQNFSAVTGACLMVKKKLYDEMGGLDEKLSVSYNDIDFCIRLLKKGFLNIYTPYCEAIHYESVSRGYDNNEEKKLRLERESEYFLSKHPDILSQCDPYFNPNMKDYFI